MIERNLVAKKEVHWWSLPRPPSAVSASDPPFIFRNQFGYSGQTDPSRQRDQSASTRYCLSERQVQSGALFRSLRKKLIVQRRHERSPENTRPVSVRSDERQNGAQIPHRSRARHAPDHARSFVLAITLPPAATISCRRAPVRAHAVSTTARTPPCQTLIAEPEQRVDGGLQKLTGGPSSRRSRHPYHSAQRAYDGRPAQDRSGGLTVSPSTVRAPADGLTARGAPQESS